MLFVKQQTLFIFISIIISFVICNENNTEPTTTTTTTTILETIETTTILETKLNEEFLLNASILNGNNSALADIGSGTNFAKHNGKLIVNQTNSQSIDGVARIDLTKSSNSSTSLSATFLIVLVCIIAIIIAVILSALFVMRRRFSSWRLNTGSSKTDSSLDKKDEESGQSKQQEEQEEKKETTTSSSSSCEVVDEKKESSQSTSCLTSVENKQALLELNMPPVTVNVDGSAQIIQNGEIVSKQSDCVGGEQLKTEQASPSSSSPLIEANDETNQTIQKAQQQQQENVVNSEQVTSSSSLIVNVLNELSESVASKLANNNQSSDPEKQPLNE